MRPPQPLAGRPRRHPGCPGRRLHHRSGVPSVVPAAKAWGAQGGAHATGLGVPRPGIRGAQGSAHGVGSGRPGCCPCEGQGARGSARSGVGVPGVGALTYFQPRVVLQLWQKMSATECSPVSSSRCSAGPQPTFTLRPESGAVDSRHGAVRPRRDSIPGGAPSPAPPRYSHRVEQVGAAVAALEGLWGHGRSHRLGPASPGPPAGHRPAASPPCNAPPGDTSVGGGGDTDTVVAPTGARGGDACHPRGTAGGRLLLWGHGGNRRGGTAGNVPSSRTTRGERSPPWGHPGVGGGHTRACHARGSTGGDTHAGCPNATLGRSSRPPGHRGGGGCRASRRRPARRPAAPGSLRGPRWPCRLWGGQRAGGGRGRPGHLGDELLVPGQVSPAVDAAVGAVGAGQVAVEGPGGQAGGGGQAAAGGGRHGGRQGPGGARGRGGHRAPPAEPLAGEAAQQSAESRRPPTPRSGGAPPPRAPPGEKEVEKGGGLQRGKGRQ